MKAMRSLLKLKKFIVFIAFVISYCSFNLSVQAQEWNVPRGDGDACEHRLLGDVPREHNRLIRSVGGREPYDLYRRLLDVVFADGGIADSLGISRPASDTIFTSSTEMAALLAVGARQPVIHAHDGMNIANSHGSGALEFVTPGQSPCGICRAFYMTTTKPGHTVHIFSHVAGHNDFSANSWAGAFSRQSDPIMESHHLARLIEKARQEQNPDEVSLWFYRLQSLVGFQDYAHGTIQLPETFNPEVVDWANMSQKPFPLEPSASVLQAFVSNLPRSTPQWKREIAERFERIVRVYPYVASTKAMNEGWATILMEVFLPYFPADIRNDILIFDYAELLSGVAGFSGRRLDNPYWLGREAWRRIRDRLNRRPDIRGLSQIEKDRIFVKYAHQAMSYMTDGSFYRTALDEHWIHKNKYVLHRKATSREQDPSLAPPQKDPRNPNQQYEQKVVVSTDPKRLIDWISQHIGEARKLQMPSVLIRNLNAFGRGVADLVQREEPHKPLLMQSVGPTLFQLANVFQAPVSLQLLASSYWLPDFAEKFRIYKQQKKFYEQYKSNSWVNEEDAPKEEMRLKTFWMRVEVTPGGDVVVEGLKDHGLSEAEIEVIRSSIHADVQAFELNSYIGYDPSMYERVKKSYEVAALPTYWKPSDIVDMNASGAMNVLSHVPYAAGAIHEYLRFLNNRIPQIIKMTIEGQNKYRFVGNKVRLQAMPSDPELRFDRRAVKELIEQGPASPVDIHFGLDSNQLSNNSINNQQFAQSLPILKTLGPDPDVDIGQGDASPGRRFWGPAPPDGEGGSGGQKPDGDPQAKEPEEIDIPLEDWAVILNEHFELPFLKPKGDKDPMVTMVQEGTTNAQRDPILWEQMTEAILKKGIASAQVQGINPRQMGFRKLYREGLKFLQETDYITADKEREETPRFKAVLFRVVDLSGSMLGRPQEVELAFFKILEALIRLKYQHVEIRSVGYDHKAHEFPGDEIFRVKLGGANTDSEGYRMVNEMIKEYDASQTNFYVVGTGDGGSHDGQAVQKELEELLQKVEYAGFVEVDVDRMGAGRWGDMLPILKSLSQNHNHFGFTTIHDESDIMQAIGEFFKSQKK